ncbi:F0F1 ATP synthase subunit epsilon [candidate division KSB1 bacterium]
MADKTLTVDIVTPEKKVFSGEVECVTAPGTEGYFQLLHNHTPFLSSIQIGEVRLKISGKDHFYSTSGGFVEISRNKVAILAETAEKSEDIDIQRAETAKNRAEERLKSPAENIDDMRAELSLYRAVNRIRIASK